MSAAHRAGLRARHLADFYSEDLVGLRANQPASAANLSWVGIYNNSTAGAVLLVYSVQVYSTNLMDVNFEIISGKAMPDFNDSYGPLDPRQPAKIGVPIAGTTAACLGSHRGGLTLEAQRTKEFSTGFPIGIVPPKFSWGIEGAAVNTGINAAFFFLQRPRGW